MSRKSSEKEKDQVEVDLLDYKEIKLSAKDKKFVGFYLGKANMNGARALEMCNFSNAKKENLRIIACQILKKPEVQRYIERLQEQFLMSAKECLTRLSDFARGSIEALVDENGYFSYERAQENNAVHLIKKLKRKTTKKESRGKTDPQTDLNSHEEDKADQVAEGSLIYEEVEFEIHDPMTALVQIGKHHKLFTDNHHLSGEVEFVTFEIETGAKASKDE